jgi:hypothetical protein
MSATTTYGASYSTEFEVHLEDGEIVIRVGSKKLTGSTGGGDGGTNLLYYKYKVYCSRDILVGHTLQTALTKDMFQPDRHP